jgi:hypothetical protein
VQFATRRCMDDFMLKAILFMKVCNCSSTYFVDIEHWFDLQIG